MSRLRFVLPPLRRIGRALGTTRRTVAAVPDVFEAILVLPHLSRQLEEIRFSTATLPEMLEEIRRVQGDTGVLPEMNDEIQRMHEDTRMLSEMHAELERMGRVTAWIPPRRVREAVRNGA